jgi:esterase/lipase superfamily enzyme
MLRALLALAVVLLGLAGVASAQPATRDRLNVLSAQTAEPGATSLRFDLSRTQGKVKALRIIANRGSAVIERIIVTYSNGQVHYEDRERPINLNPGERTAEIDPRDIERFLDSVEIILQAGSRPVRLEVWAMQSPEGRLARRETGTRYRRIMRPPEAAPPLREGTPEAMRPPAPAPAPGAPLPKDTPKSVTPEAGKPYVEVDVYYGTNRRAEAARRRDGRTLETYGTKPERTITFGRAVVTIPTEGRQRGEINRPEWDLVVASIALRGEDPARDFTLLSVEKMERADFITAARAHLDRATAFRGQAFVFVHGYNVSFDDALFRAAQMTFDMGFDGLPLIYSWPSLGGVRGYFLDQRRARDARDTMREFLDFVAAETGAAQIHLIAHSMGANPILEALQTYVPGATVHAGPPRFSEVILAAPDVLRDDFERIAARIRGLARGVTLFASSNDRALQLSSWTTLGESPAGYVPGDAPPVIAPGVDTIDVSALNTGWLGLNHGTFADRETLIGDIKALLSDAMRRAPGERLPAYHSVPVPPSSSYWRYQP